MFLFVAFLSSIMKKLVNNRAKCGYTDSASVSSLWASLTLRQLQGLLQSKQWPCSSNMHAVNGTFMRSTPQPQRLSLKFVHVAWVCCYVSTERQDDELPRSNQTFPVMSELQRLTAGSRRVSSAQSSTGRRGRSNPENEHIYMRSFTTGGKKSLPEKTLNAHAPHAHAARFTGGRKNISSPHGEKQIIKICSETENHLLLQLLLLEASLWLNNYWCHECKNKALCD